MAKPDPNMLSDAKMITDSESLTARLFLIASDRQRPDDERDAARSAADALGSYLDVMIGADPLDD